MMFILDLKKLFLTIIFISFINSTVYAKSNKESPLLFEQTQEILNKIENIIGMETLAYWNSSSGSICANDLNVLYELIKRNKKKKNMAISLNQMAEQLKHH